MSKLSRQPLAAMPSMFTVDVEDWFHILELPATPKLAEWDALPSRVERNFHVLLDLFAETGTKVTCFFLGYVAQRFPHLVREAAGAGHEIASHGYAHELVWSLTPAAFLEDARRSRLLLEDTIGAPVHGYRATGFSVNAATPWFFDQLLAAGYRYDCSVFPAPRAHGGGLAGAHYRPHVELRAAGALHEVPVSVLKLLGRPVYLFGGGYLRLFPYPLIRALGRRILAERRPIIFYIHPREIDPTQPRLPMAWRRQFRSYVGLRTVADKIRRIQRDFTLVTVHEYLQRPEYPDRQAEVVA